LKRSTHAVWHSQRVLMETKGDAACLPWLWRKDSDEQQLVSSVCGQALSP
jgi:hypothetical protein